MPRKKLTEKTLSENQEGLFAIANALLVDIDVTIYAKLVFGYIIKLSGRDISKEDGYAHVSNAEMRKGCEIGSDTMTNAVVELVNAGLITVVRGKKRSKGEKGVENRYFLPDEIKEKIHFKTNSIDISTEKENISTEKENISTEKIHQIDELLKRIEALELRINELTEENRVLSEKVETIAEKRKSSIDMEMDMEINSCNSSCIHLSNLNNSTQNTIPDKSCSMSDEEKDTGSEYTQPDPVPYVFDERYFDSTPEPVKRKKKSSAVSSSLQIIEEENHPDTGDNNSSNDERTTADRLSSSQLDSKTQPQPLEKGKALEEAFNPYISKWVKGLSSYDVIVNRDVAQFAVLEPFLRDNPDYTSENCVTLTYMFGVSVELMQCALNKVRKYGNMYPELENTSETLREAS